jgi:4-carboxymuconolactone decarboxylase
MPQSPCSGDAIRPGQPRVADVDDVERLLRRLAVNDEESVDRVLVSGPEPLPPPLLSEKVELLVRLAALLALGAATVSLRTMVERAIAAGATESEIVEVLVTVGPAVGLARVVSAAPRLALALGYDIDADE